MTVQVKNWVDEFVGPKVAKGHEPPKRFKSKFVIPELPLPDLSGGNVESHDGNWCWRHLDNTVHSYRNEESLEPVELNREPVTSENPLVIDCYDSIRSPYSYLVVPRLAWLRSNYNVEVNIHVIFPIAIRTPGLTGSSQTVGDQASHKGGRWYYLGNMYNDTKLAGEFHGIPFKVADPDPVVQNFWPLGDENPDFMQTAPIEEQPYIRWMVRLANAAELAGKSLEFLLHTGGLVWGGISKSDYWPEDIPEAFEKTGLNYDDTIKDIQANVDKYDACWKSSQLDFYATGHAGVPNMSFNGEPFFGQDRFDYLYYRLRQNGLTMRDEPIPPIVTKPLRWPDGI
jgi:2-hydroxychromene-2-carboxylate isomerase